jgi:antitoxin component of RelBE/YafQ-DinJ toxin-antitoxin module
MIFTKPEQMNDHIIFRCPTKLKIQVEAIAKSYGLKPTQLVRHLVVQNLPLITKNRFYDVL